MSIETAIQAAQQKVAAAYTAASTKGATMPATQDLSNLATTIGTISGGGGGGEWQPDPSWWDIKTILENDTEDYAGKAIILYANSDDTTTFTISGSVVAVKTSDGSFYTSTTTHTWDRTKDKPVSDDESDTTPKFATRYVIIYLNTNTPVINEFSNFKTASLYAIFGCSFYFSFYGFDSSFFYKNRTLMAFEFLDGYKFPSGADFTFFCDGCYSLQKLPDDLDVSSVTQFARFCYDCYSLQKLPDNLDVSSGINFSSFCNGCYSLQKLPDDLDVSSGTNFSTFCKECRSLQKLPDVLDVSSGTNFDQFCYGCYSLKKLPDVLDVSSGTNFSSFCYDCRSLQKLPDVLDVSSGTNFNGFCNSCYSLVKANIKLGNSSITTLSSSNFINIESLKYIADNAPTVSGLTLTIGSTNITRAGGASGEIITTLTNKGWTVN